MAANADTTTPNWFIRQKDKVLTWGHTRVEKLPRPLQRIWLLGKSTYQLFDAHDTGSLGAGLSYYMMFSIAPLLLIIVSVTGAVLGHDAVNGAVKEQLQKLMGPSTAQQIQDMIKAAYQPGRNWIATVISIVLLITGGIGVFDQLRSALNVVWDIKPDQKIPLLQYLRKRLFSLGMILCIALLLVVSLLANAAVAALAGYFNRLLPGIAKVIFMVIEIIFSFTITTTLFAFIYRFMADIKIKWRWVWRGALFTSVLFAIGKYLIGIYLGNSHLGTTYGTASSVIVILLWVYYSSQIVFFGAEFTRALATQNGEKLDTRPEVAEAAAN